MWKKSLIGLAMMACGFLVLSSCSHNTYTLATGSGSGEKKIITFSVPGAVSSTITNNYVVVTVPADVDISALTPVITISADATVSPTSGELQDFTNPPILYKVTAQDGSITYYAVTVTEAKDISTFSILDNTGVITGTDIAVTVPYDTLVTELVPTITVSDGAEIYPRSGVAQNFTNPITYFVAATDGSIKMYSITVIVGPSNTATVTSGVYIISAGGTAHETITSVPYGAISKAELLAALTMDQGDETWNSSNISNPVVTGNTLVVTAENGTTVVTYTVTTDAASDVATLTSSIYIVSAGGTAHETITGLDKGVSKTNFLAALTKGQNNQSWNSVGINNPVADGDTLIVTAQDGTMTVTYTISVPTKAIGESYLGGKVAYVLRSVDPGYILGATHGLIAATTDNSGSGIAWIIGGTTQHTDNGNTLTAIGTGLANTNAMRAQTGYTGGAAKICYDYSTGNNSDLHSWYLPSKDELNTLYLNEVTIGGFAEYIYWSSSEYDTNDVWILQFANGTYDNSAKSTTFFYVRCVRAF